MNSEKPLKVLTKLFHNFRYFSHKTFLSFTSFQEFNLISPFFTCKSSIKTFSDLWWIFNFKKLFSLEEIANGILKFASGFETRRFNALTPSLTHKKFSSNQKEIRQIVCREKIFFEAFFWVFQAPQIGRAMKALLRLNFSNNHRRTDRKKTRKEERKKLAKLCREFVSTGIFSEMMLTWTGKPAKGFCLVRWYSNEWEKHAI